MVDNTPDYSSSPVPHARVFSPAQADRTLPLVSRIVQDILQVSTQMRDLQEQFDGLQGHADPDLPRQVMLKLSASRRLFEKYCRELSALGCRLSDERAGAVDFPALLEGRQVVLSWKLGEPRVGHWHDPGQGPDHRYPLSRTPLSFRT